METSSKLITFIEKFPKGSIWQTRYICLPFIIIVSTYLLSHGSLSHLVRVAWFVLGVAMWTLLEYVLHRWVLHYRAKTALGRAVVDRLHEKHHVDPKDQSQVCVPFSLLLPLWLVMYGIIVLFGGGLYASLIFISGVALMMILYDITHFSTHYMQATHPYLQFVKKYHMTHHFVDAGKRFGVTSPIWDWVFRTYKQS